MKNVNLFGMTTAEKLVKLEKAYDEIMASVIYNGHYEGEWNDTTEYGFGAYVNYKGSSYIYINEVASINTNPENGVPWVLIAEKGDAGGLQSMTPSFPFSGQRLENYITHDGGFIKIKLPINFKNKEYKYFRFYTTARITLNEKTYIYPIHIPEIYIPNEDFLTTNYSMLNVGVVDSTDEMIYIRMLYNISRDSDNYIYTLQFFHPYTTPIAPEQVRITAAAGIIGFSED